MTNYAILMLTARLNTLELQKRDMSLLMATEPNQYTYEGLAEIEPMIRDLKDAVSKLVKEEQQ